MELDQRHHKPVAHLVIDMKDGRIRLVIAGPNPLVAEMNRLRDRFVFQRTSDAATSHLCRGRREVGPGQTTCRWEVEEGKSDDPVALACNPEAILSRARI